MAKAMVMKVYGSLAALVKESVWEMLLHGRQVGVLEPDARRFTLLRNGEFVDVVEAPNAEKAVMVFCSRNAEFNLDAQAMLVNQPTHWTWDVKNGFPNFLSITQEQIARHRRENMDARKLAARMRELIRTGHRNMQFGDVLKELALHGSVKEGRD